MSTHNWKSLGNCENPYPKHQLLVFCDFSRCQSFIGSIVTVKSGEIFVDVVVLMDGEVYSTVEEVSNTFFYSSAPYPYSKKEPKYKIKNIVFPK